MYKKKSLNNPKNPFISTNDEYINKHVKYHLKISLKKSVQSQEIIDYDEDIFEGFDEYGTRIEETNSENS